MQGSRLGAAELDFAAITKYLETTIKVNFDFNRKMSASKVCGEADIPRRTPRAIQIRPHSIKGS
jgi:hypothetical protein